MSRLGSASPAGMIYELVEQTFALAPDVPMTCASLGGFCLGVLYVTLYLTGSDVGPVAMLTAAGEFARDLTA